MKFNLMSLSVLLVAGLLHAADESAPTELAATQRSIETMPFIVQHTPVNKQVFPELPNGNERVEITGEKGLLAVVKSEDVDLMQSLHKSIMECIKTRDAQNCKAVLPAFAEWYKTVDVDQELKDATVATIIGLANRVTTLNDLFEEPTSESLFLANAALLYVRLQSEKNHEGLARFALDLARSELDSMEQHYKSMSPEEREQSAKRDLEGLKLMSASLEPQLRAMLAASKQASPTTQQEQ